MVPGDNIVDSVVIHQSVSLQISMYLLSSLESHLDFAFLKEGPV